MKIVYNPPRLGMTQLAAVPAGASAEQPRPVLDEYWLAAKDSEFTKYLIQRDTELKSGEEKQP